MEEQPRRPPHLRTVLRVLAAVSLLVLLGLAGAGWMAYQKLNGNIHTERDPNVGLNLSAGPHLLDGTNALAYVRAREYVGDRSDTNRMARQLHFLSLVAAKLRSNDALFGPTRLYPVLDAATSALTADPGLDSLTKLYGMVQRLRAVPAGQVHSGTLPRRPYAPDRGRDVLVEPAASQLFAALRSDQRAATVELLHGG